VALPPFAHLLLGRTQVVRGGRKWQGAFHLRHHDGADPVENPALAVEFEGLIEQVPLRENRRGAPEAVPLARDGVDDVDLDRRVAAQVLDRARRADVGEAQAVVVPDGGRPLGERLGVPSGQTVAA
jgi:hypothetical protein